MAKYTFADKYSEERLSPTAEQITSREATVIRILSDIKDDQILDLVMYYYGNDVSGLEWLRDQFRQEDVTFSMVNNANEARLLTALILSELISNNHYFSILAVIVSSFKGKRTPPKAAWLVSEAEAAYRNLVVTDQDWSNIEVNIVPITTPKLSEELKALAVAETNTVPNDALSKVNNEARKSVLQISQHFANTLKELNNRIEIIREENQILWWWTGGYSNILGRSFKSTTPALAGIIAAIELGDLTTHSYLGRLGIPVILEKVTALAKTDPNQSFGEFDSIINSLAPEDLEKINLPLKSPPFISPVSTAINLAKTSGNNAWSVRFKEQTGMESSLSIETVILAEQLYREHLLGQVL